MQINRFNEIIQAENKLVKIVYIFNITYHLATSLYKRHKYSFNVSFLIVFHSRNSETNFFDEGKGPKENIFESFEDKPASK